MVTPVIPWVSRTTPVVDGEEVRAAIKNRHPLELQQRTDNLKQRLDNIQAGEALFVHDVALSPAVKVGHAVYWDVNNLHYDRAIAAVAFDAGVGGYVVAPSSYVVGICYSKSGSTRGSLIPSGTVRDFDFTNGAGVDGQDPTSSGAYYLSASSPGTYTTQKPPVGIYVMFLRGDGVAHIQPTPREVLENHIHFAFDLFAVPAGTVECPLPDRVYEFLVEDDAAPGWLPASNPIFGGMAPAGAVYGYNLGMHPELERVFPPIPFGTAYLEQDGIGVAADRYSIDLNGIWWYAGCYSKAPWPTEPRPCGSSSSVPSPAVSSSSSSSPSVDPLVCFSGPYLEEMGFPRVDPSVRTLRLYFTKMVFKTNNALVTSLAPASNSPITVVGCDGDPATTGDLKLGLDLSLSVVEGEEGYQAFKGVTGTTFKRGPVVSGLKAGSNVQFQPVPGQSEIDGSGFLRGKATIDVVLPGSEQQEAPIALVALDSVREELINDVDGGIFYLSFPSDRESSLRGRITVPFEGLITNPEMLIRLWLLGRTAGTLPALEISYRRLPRPDPNTLCAAVALPTVDVVLADLGTCVVGANEYIEIDSDAFAIARGDTIYFTLKRSAPDGYAGDVGILRMSNRISAG